MSLANIIRAGPCGVAVRGVRSAAYASYFARCSADAESVGMTTRPCETRAFWPSGWCARKARIWESWISAKSSDSSAFTTLLVSRFIACSPAHCAERRLPPPYHRRRPSPAECGWTRSEKASKPTVPLKSLAFSPRMKDSNRSTRS